MQSETRTAATSEELSAETRAALRDQLAAMLERDQLIRIKVEFRTSSDEEARAIRDALNGIDDVETFQRRKEVLQTQYGDLDEDAVSSLLDQQREIEMENVEALETIIRNHGWPSQERIGGVVDPAIFLLHAPDRMASLDPLLREQVDIGHMPPMAYAQAVDKARKERGQLQLYGSGDEYNPKTGDIAPPQIADIDQTNAARADLGLPPLEDYRLVQD